MELSNKEKPILIVLCGIKASGKSFIIDNLLKQYPQANIVSRKDTIKDLLKLYKKENEKDIKSQTIINNINLRLNDSLELCPITIYNSENITIKERKQILNNLKIDCYKICYIVNTPFPQCLINLQDRKNNFKDLDIKEDLLEEQLKSFEIPFYNEGWDEICLYKQNDYNTSKHFEELFLKVCEGYNQRNKHHTQDLGKHLRTVGDVLKSKTNNNILIKAGYFHDVGKLATQTIDKEGQAHYYSHANVGAYNLMCSISLYNAFEQYLNEDTLRWLFYINYHMILKNIRSDKSINKYKKLFSEELYNDLLLLREADQGTITV